MHIVSIVLLPNPMNEKEWQLVISRDDSIKNVVATDLTEIQEQVEAIKTFAEGIKTQEQIEQEVAQEKMNELLAIITEKTTDEEKLALIEQYPIYQNGVQYSKDQAVPYVVFENRLYKIIGATFTSQPSWAPNLAPSLFVEVAPPNTIAPWVQPTGAHDAYQMGDQVTFEGFIYKSLIDANVWSPTDYPEGWERGDPVK